jgi:hypothetical protein
MKYTRVFSVGFCALLCTFFGTAFAEIPRTKPVRMALPSVLKEGRLSPFKNCGVRKEVSGLDRVEIEKNVWVYRVPNGDFSIAIDCRKLLATPFQWEKVEKGLPPGSFAKKLTENSAYFEITQGQSKTRSYLYWPKNQLQISFVWNPEKKTPDFKTWLPKIYADFKFAD